MDARDVLVSNLMNLYGKLNELDDMIGQFYEGLNKKILGAAEKETLHKLESERDETFRLARAFAGRLLKLDRKLFSELLDSNTIL